MQEITPIRELYIGLMSGTSMDAIDAALVDFSAAKPQLIATHKTPMPNTMREKLLALCTPGYDEINRCGEIDIELGKLFAATANELLQKSKISSKEIKAIGSHGQTIRHKPNAEAPFTLQIGNPHVIAELTEITTVADFRTRDMVKSGQGAPLAPAFHAYVLRDHKQNRIILNLGGIANITYLPSDIHLPIIGFDTGPANILLDTWINKHLKKSFDKNGEWAKSGKTDNDLLKLLLQDNYFKLTTPKSTGREYFNSAWLEKYLNYYDKTISAQDVQATLTELTARNIADAILTIAHSNEIQILVCGGGIHNNYLLERLKMNCKNSDIQSTEKFGIHPDWMEAMAFAWLAQQTLLRNPGNLPSVTGAEGNAILGAVFLTPKMMNRNHR